MNHLMYGMIVAARWAAGDGLEMAPGGAPEGNGESHKGKLSLWAHNLLCLAGRGASSLAAWLGHNGLADLTLADRVGRGGC
jgi:hypothetical protein